MAILKSLIMRNSRKKIGGIVTYGLKGQTVGREQAAKVTNRRTPAQMSQRVRLANLVQLWKRMSFWAKKGAFQTKLQKESDYNAFVKANIKGTTAYLTKAQVEAGSCVLSPVIISKGSLNPVQTFVGSTALESDIIVGTSALAADATLGDLAAAIIANNNGIYNGDQISCIVGIQSSTSDNPYVVVRAYEYTLDISDTTPYAGSAIADMFSVAASANVSGSYVLVHTFDNSMVGGAFVLSRTVNGALQVSNARLVLNSAAETFLTDYTSATALSNAIASYGTQQTDFLIPGEGGTVNPNQGGSTPAPIALAINSVFIGGMVYAAGDYLDNNIEVAGGDAITLTANQIVDESLISNVRVVFNDGTEDLELTNVGANGAIIAADFTSAGAGVINDRIGSVSAFAIDYNGQSVQINMATSADPGDVTP